MKIRFYPCSEGLKDQALDTEKAEETDKIGLKRGFVALMFRVLSAQNLERKAFVFNP